MKIFYLLTPLMLAFVLFSCGGGGDTEISTDAEGDDSEEVDDTPIEASFDEILNGEIEDYKTVTFESFIAPLPSTLYGGDGEISLNFYERRNQTEGRHMRVDLHEGEGNNSAEPIPDNYQQDDLKIHADDGTVLTVGQAVRITGTYSEASDENYQYIDLIKIEPVDFTFSESVFDNAVELTDDFINNEDNDKGYAYIEGTLELMMFMQPYDGAYAVTINQTNNSFTESVYIPIGNGPSSMNMLYDDFTDADFIVRDFNGDEYNGAKTKFRLYGTFNQLNVESKGMFTVEEIVAL